MGNELIWYIAFAIIYLIFGLMRKKQRQQGKHRPAVPFDEALRELSAAAASEIPHAETQAVRPTPVPARLMAARQHPRHTGLEAPKPSFFDDSFEAAPAHSARIHQKPVPVAAKRVASSVKRPRSPQREAIIVQLKSPVSARTAVLLSEVLGKPHALRRR